MLIEAYTGQLSIRFAKKFKEKFELNHIFDSKMRELKLATDWK